MIYPKYPFIILSLIFFLTACGGGGDDSSSETTTDPVITDPAVDATEVPLAPSGLSGSVMGDTQIDLDWLDNSSGDGAESAFSLERKLGVDGSYAELTNLAADTTSYSDQGLTAGATYYYRIRAYNTLGSSEYSNEAVATTTQTSVVPTGPTDVWAKSYGAPDDSKAAAIAVTSDGGYVVAGTMDIYSTTAVDDQFWVVKLNAGGDVQWQKSYGGLDSELAAEIKQTADGGYIVVGTSESFDLNSAYGDVWVLRLANNGDVVWQKKFGASPPEHGMAIIQTDDDGDGSRDNGFLVAAYQENAGDRGWLIKLDSNGTIEWQKLIGDYNTVLYALEQTPDRGYVVVGTRWSDVLGGEQELWILRLDAAGNITWQKSIQGADLSWVFDVALVDSDANGVKDDGFLLAGYADTDASTDFLFEAWVLRLAADGSIVWQNTYGDGSVNTDTFYAAEQMADGNFVLAGATSGFGGSSTDFWLMTLDASGGVVMAKRFGGLGSDTAYAMQPTADNGFIMAGSSSSFVTDRTDMWVVKLNSTADLTFDAFLNASIQDTAVVVTATNSIPQDTTDVADTVGITVYEDTFADVADTSALVATQSE